MEILGYLEKVFYDGNSKLPGGKYTFTICVNGNCN